MRVMVSSSGAVRSGRASRLRTLGLVSPSSSSSSWTKMVSKERGFRIVSSLIVYIGLHKSLHKSQDKCIWMISFFALLLFFHFEMS